MGVFSTYELSLMQNAEVMPHKRQVLIKISDRFSSIEADLVKAFHSTHALRIPAGALVNAGKISRGENYRGQPYLVLDYPRLFTKTDILNIRLLFWWGHYFTMTLHLAGQIWEGRKETLSRALDSEPLGSYWIQFDGSPWENDLESPHLVKVSELTKNKKDNLLKSSFVKIVNQLPIAKVSELESFSTSTFENLISVLEIE